MIIKAITASNEMWNKVKNYADSCSWKAGKSLANAMMNNGFKYSSRRFLFLKGIGSFTPSPLPCKFTAQLRSFKTFFFFRLFSAHALPYFNSQSGR